MASTNKTANFELNQWVLTDPFLMEDMNADNIKIDTAMAAMRYERLIGATLTTEAQTVELDLSGVNMANISAIDVFCINPSDNDMISMRINNLSSTDNYQVYNSSAGGYIGAYTAIGAECGITHFSFCRPNIWIRCGINALIRVSPAMKSSAVTKLMFLKANGTNLKAGTKLLVMGVRV